MAKGKIGVRVYVTLSAVAGLLVGIVWYGGVRKVNEAILAGGLTFIVVLVGIATLTLMTKGEEPQDPNKPRLK
jgi:hypothetical protein